ncbi:Uncharacterized protein FWK35_00030817 [Aphis craccivora]|uniref:Uncharacterized protein n=1 Tax=Aphis craccivora TaxID=307492 RepID=A0A6G0VZK2_APHCR|nr:Uncharacterized protein FWK35_00030817 [Aphis craccivora]
MSVTYSEAGEEGCGMRDAGCGGIWMRFLNQLKHTTGQYIIKEYASRHAMWPYAIRTGCRINTNMKLEAMHRVFKDIYMKGSKGKRLDTLIAILLKMSQ